MLPVSQSQACHFGDNGLLFGAPTPALNPYCRAYSSFILLTGPSLPRYDPQGDKIYYEYVGSGSFRPSTVFSVYIRRFSCNRRSDHLVNITVIALLHA